MSSDSMNSEQRRVVVNAETLTRVSQRKGWLTAWSTWAFGVLEFRRRRPTNDAGILKRWWPWCRRARTLVRLARTAPCRLLHKPAFTVYVYRYRGIRRAGAWLC